MMIPIVLSICYFIKPICLFLLLFCQQRQAVLMEVNFLKKALAEPEEALTSSADEVTAGLGILFCGA